MTLTLEGVSKVVNGQTHIHPTDLTLDKGTMNVLLGPTLSSKTSLMRLMAGLDAPATGRILWNGQDVTGQRVQDRKVAMVCQQFSNYPSMTVFENIASPLRLMGRSSAEIEAAVRKTADLMQLTPMLGRKPLELSGGQQQRCALAVDEITGSEAFVHHDHHGERWVGLVQGVHDLSIDAEQRVWLDPVHVCIFGEDGRLVAPAASALAA